MDRCQKAGAVVCLTLFGMQIAEIALPRTAKRVWKRVDDRLDGMDARLSAAESMRDAVKIMIGAK